MYSSVCMPIERWILLIIVLENEHQLTEVQAQFTDVIRAIPHDTISTAIKFRGGSYHSEVWWIPDLGFWAHLGYPPSQKANRNRYWNVFGLGKPASSVRIVCEINSPFIGINRRIGGAFATGEKEGFLILHRGNLRSRGLNKSRFWQDYRGPIVQAIDGDSEERFALVANLNSPFAGQEVGKFVHEVGRIQGSAQEGR